MKPPEWLNRWFKGEQREEDRALLRDWHGSLTTLLRSSGWAHLKSLLLEDAQGSMTALLEKLPERERDYLASRIQTINWILDLPGTKRQEYSDILSEVHDDHEPEFVGESDPLSPVPKEQ